MSDTSTVAVRYVEPSRRVPSMADDVRDGLRQRPRELHPKYFYDQRGSELFDRICDTPEYYLTRTENALLRAFAGDIMSRTEPESVIELGSGTSRKTRRLLDAWTGSNRVFWPFDVSEEMLVDVARDLNDEYGDLDVRPLVGDYTAGFGNFPDLEGRTLALFLGSTIGNFAPDFAEHFLMDFVSHLDPGDFFLLGADLAKEPAVIHAAYNDAEGVTAAFNRNVLHVINRELDADFEPEAFAHRAIYNESLHRIEMYLDSVEDQRVRIGALDLDLRFDKGEAILTEISRKFTWGQLDRLFEAADLDVVHSWVDDEYPYALLLARR
ncbi:MAG: L-histidine N(alpha)-methyltransferase [Pseudomonadota bacterium]